MKKFFSLIICLAGMLMTGNAQSVSVNTDGSTADASSILEVKSTSKGMLAPRMTTAQRTAIVAPANGLLVYDIDVKSFWYYNGTAWTNITGSAGSGGQMTLPFVATVNSPNTPFHIKNTYSGATAIAGENPDGYGVWGYTADGSAIMGYAADSGNGVFGQGINGTGVKASSSFGNAIEASAYGTNYVINAYGLLADAIYGKTDAASNAAIKGEATAAGSMGVFGTSIGTGGYGVRGFSGIGTGVYGSTNTGHGIIASANSGVGIRTSSTSGNALEVFGKLKIYGAAVSPQNGAVLTSDAEGNAKWKLNRVAFRASGNIGTIVDEMTTSAIFPTEEYDYSNSFDLQAGIFTAPATGVYNLGASIDFYISNDQTNNISEADLWITVNRGGINTSYHAPYATIRNDKYTSIATMSFGIDLKLLAGDKVKISGNQSNYEGATIQWTGSFYGHLVFAE